MNELPLTVRRRVYGLKGIMGMRETISRYNLDVGALQTKYSALFNELHRRRCDIVCGKVEPSAEDVRSGLEYDLARNAKRSEGLEKPAEEEVPPPAARGEGDASVGVPNFWLGALKGHPDLQESITERDEKVLAYLTNIREELFPNPFHGFRLHFEFAPNEYFTERVLVKEYWTKEAEFDTVLVKSEGTPITWSDSTHNVTVMLQKKKQRNRRGGQTRVVSKEVPCDSFFNFFTPPKPSTPESIQAAIAEGGTEGPDSDEVFVQDYEMGCTIRDDLIPSAVDWYTGWGAYDEGYEDDGEQGEEDDGYEDMEEQT
jgi:nucleosome assembly protein 1-like 1